ncbi:MAG: cysteine--tRNA ligase [bacterium]
MGLKIYNTLTRQKEDLVPIHPGRVGMYVCGPTVYDYFHIGNARPFVMFDIFRRYLQYRGYQVRFVMNLTDIDDRIINRANELGVSAHEIALKYTQAFFEDIQKLGIRPADVYPKATEHIGEIIQLITALMEKGCAYQAGGDVIFEVEKFVGYTKLSGKKLDDLEAGHRVGVDEHKRNPLDFVLWKAMKPGEPWWDSPWGKGRPGWHAECSAMSMRYLGETFDIHAGGLDLIFPHHENEIAQSEAATGKPFVKYWMHNGFIDVDGEKMSKSLGNFRTAREIAQRFPATVIRLFFLAKHYRGPIDFSLEALQNAVKARERMSLAYQALLGRLEPGNKPTAKGEANTPEQQSFQKTIAGAQAGFIAALDDDFNTVEGLAVIFDFVREVNRWMERQNPSARDLALLSEAKNLFDEWNGVLGVFETGTSEIDNSRFEAVMKVLLELRQSLRAEKNFKLADQLRDGLRAAGIIVEDGAGGSRWRVE